MSEKKLMLEIFRKKNAEEFSVAISDPESRADTGSAMAAVGASAAALLHRACAMCGNSQDEKLVWLLRNTEILRTYMVNLIDEDVKCRGPLRRALKENDERSIEAARQTGVNICSEIIHMMQTCLEMAEGLIPFADQRAASYVKESAELALAAAKGCVPYILMMGSYSTDDTYRYIIRRENELNMEELTRVYTKIQEALAAM